MIIPMEKRRKLETVRYTIKSEKLPRKMRPLKLVVLADLHDRLWGGHQQFLTGKIEKLQGDMVLCAGDMLIAEKHASMDHAVELFEELQKRKIPVICGNGNHESRMRQHPEFYGDQYERYSHRLQECGVRILADEVMDVPWEGRKIRIYGYELPLSYYRKFRQPPFDGQDLIGKFGTPDPELFHILLAHNPVYFDSYASWGADLTLSGHLHGGIIRIPGIGGLITPQAQLFPKYDRGLVSRDKKYMAVSAGLGGHTVPIRIFNPPQLILITVEGNA